MARLLGPEDRSPPPRSSAEAVARSVPEMDKLVGPLYSPRYSVSCCPPPLFERPAGSSALRSNEVVLCGGAVPCRPA